MTNVGDYDSERIEKLQTWLEDHGIEVIKLGNDLTMRSPFKEFEKRKVQPGYKDGKNRLWVTIRKDHIGKPSIIWQCWWSKGQGGKGRGGHNAYPLSLLTRVDKEEIHAFLGLETDDEIEKAETFEDKLFATITQKDRQDIKIEIIKKDRIPWPVPDSVVEMFAGRTNAVDSMVTKRGISPEVGKKYRLGYDQKTFEIFLPWIVRNEFNLGQWWDGNAYRFEARDGIHFQKGDSLFGTNVWDPERPLVLCEGCFTAMSVLGCAAGGSTLTEAQKRLLISLQPKSLVIAFDNDTAGYTGASGILEWAKVNLNAELNVVFPPKVNDWNDLIKEKGLQETMAIFCEKLVYSRKVGPLSALLGSYV